MTALLERTRGRQGLRALSPAELRELQRLYRTATSDLSLARSRGQADLAAYLNQLVGQAHSVVYARRTERHWHLGRFFGVTVPQTCKRNWRCWVTAAAVLLATSVVGYVTTAQNPAWAEVLVSPALRAQIEPFIEKGEAAGHYFEDAASTLGGGGFASVLMTNNIRVALLCFALGIAWGLATLLVLAQNGLMLGAALGLGAYHGKVLLMLAVVAPHGVVELSAVVIAAAAGLRMGFALVDPGDLPRRDALVVAAREAVQMALGTVPMFVFAGLVEALVSPQSGGPLGDNSLRLLFGLAGGLLLYTWLLLGDLAWGRRRQRI